MVKKFKNYQIILMEIGFLGIVYIVINTKIFAQLTKCYIKERLNILCPGCGGTRCIRSLFKGDIVSAFLFHPIITITAIYLFLCNIIYLINRKREKKIMTWIYPKYYYTIILAVILVVFTILRNIL